MPRAPRYKMLADGKIRDQRKSIDIFVKSFEVVKSGRLEVVKIEPNAGRKLRIARYAIDETDYSLGPITAASAPRGGGTPHSEKQSDSQAVTVRRNISLSLTREEALRLVKMFRALEVTLTTELIGETMESGK